MDEDKPIVAPARGTTAGVLLIIILSVAVLTEVIYTLGVSTDRYFQVHNVLIGVLIVCLLLGAGWLHDQRSDQLTLYADRLEIRTRRGATRILYLRDMTGWHEDLDDENDRSGVVLIWPEGSYTVYDRSDQAYDYLLEQGYTIIPKPSRGFLGWVWDTLRFFGFGILIFVAGSCVYLALYPHKGGPTHPLTLVTRHYPSLRQHGDDDPTLEIVAQGLEEFTFVVDDRAFIDSFRARVPTDLGGDTCYIQILDYDYAVKIAHTRPSTWWDRHHGWHEIEAVEARW